MSLSSNGHISNESKEEDNKESKEEDREDDYDNDEYDLLEVGMLQHHEIENFTMDEDKIESTCRPLSWSNCDATTFNVRRGPNYVAGQKSPSKKALYKVFAMDAYKLPKKINKIFQFINIDKYINKYKSKLSNGNDILPPLFILNCMVPNYPPEIMGGRSDGEGYQLLIYAHLTNEIEKEIINCNEKDMRPSVKLLRDFIHSDLVNSEIRNRFKVIARVMNPNYTDFGFLANRLVKRYNGKPFLARTSSTFYYQPYKYFAADIDVHVFGYPARQGLSYVKDTIQTAIYDIGFVIEGHTNDQLPEQILACCRVSKMGVDLCKLFPKKIQKIYFENKQLSHSSSNLLNGIKDQKDQKDNNNNNNNNNNDNNNNNNNDDNNNNNKQNNNHRNGNITSKSATTLPSTSTNTSNSNVSKSNVSNQNKNHKTDKTQTQTSSSWGWGYFG